MEVHITSKTVGAEISNTTPKMCISKQENKSEGNRIPKDEDDTEARYKIYSILSFFSVLVLLGLPIWWYTTRVYRAALPYRRMDDKDTVQLNPDKDFGIPLSLEYDVLISLVHPDPAGLYIELNGEDLDDGLDPLLGRIESIADFVVKSQWIYMTELGAVPQKVDGVNVLFENQLPHVITPLESKLWSNISPRPTLNLVVYFPRCNDSLYIHTNDNRRVGSNAFLSPRWGGIYVLNPDEASCKSRRFEPDVGAITSVFTTQLKRLFKIANAADPGDIRQLRARRAEEMLDSTRRTLKSLSQLLSEISSIVISDEVGRKIGLAVENADMTEKFLEKNEVKAALRHAKVAFFNAEAAFSDPSLLALLYFPEDQKYAVYIPLFLPIMIPVFMSLKLVRKWKMEQKAKTD